jgi:hypothetical protein
VGCEPADADIKTVKITTGTTGTATAASRVRARLR